jgi:hypothetical protein
VTPQLPVQKIQPSSPKEIGPPPPHVSSASGYIFYSSLPEQLRIFLEHLLKLFVYFYVNLMFNFNIQVDDDRVFGCFKSNAWLARRCYNTRQPGDGHDIKKHDDASRAWLILFFIAYSS